MGVANPKLGEYTFQLACFFLSPADSTTYIFGSAPDTIPANASFYRTTIPYPGVIRRANIMVLVAGTLGTTEQCTASIRLNDTSDTTISAVVQHNTLTQTYANVAMNIAVVAGDYIEFKIVTPAWVTNPTSVKWQGVVMVESV